MKITKHARRDAKGIFRSTFTNGVMDGAKVRTAVKSLLEHKPRGYLGMLEHFTRLVKLEEARRSARVESAIPLSPEQQAGVSSSLERIYGRGLSISFAQNPALVGGLRVRVGSDVYDGSIAARLQRLEENF